MILTEKKAVPVIQLLVKNTVEIIKEETGVDVPEIEIFDELSDIEWIIEAGINENDEYLININTVVNQLDRITDRIEKVYGNHIFEASTEIHIGNKEYDLVEF